MTENQSPSINPADQSSMAGVLREAIRKEIQQTDGMMPVEVVSYDRATNRAVVKHSIQMMGSDGSKVDRAPIASIRVMQPGNGAFSMSLPIKPGDRGWLMAADRDLSLFQQDLDRADAPNTKRMKSFQDGLFMPDAMKQGAAPAGMEDRVVIGTTDGGATFSFDAAGFYFKIGGVEWTLTAEGFKQTGGTMKHDGRNVGSTHTHGGIVPGNGNTQVPNA